MCGIVGIASCKPQCNKTWLALGRDAMTHRGPDDAGEWWSLDSRIGFAHRRLAIIDVSEAGHQPMHDANATLSIVFNGEIYNFNELRKQLLALGHKFRSHSDTEVVLIAYLQWGGRCVNMLNGMFALAIFDSRSNSVFLARDRAGEKPLFYRHTPGELRFGSELKALMADRSLPRKVNRDSLDCYLAMGYVPGDRCILHGYNKLPAAHALQFDIDSGQIKVWKYWNLPEIDTNRQEMASEASLLDDLETLLEDSVSGQMVADVPVGVLLSGGVDSSLITAMAVRGSTRVKTFSIGFPGHGELDETKHARRIAQHFGTEHTELMAEPATAELISSLARQFDEPMVDSSMIPTFLVSHLVRQHCSVALGGDGGDELFGGYGHYNRLQAMSERVNRVPFPLRKGVAIVAEHLLPAGFAGGNARTWLMALDQDFRMGVPAIATCFDSLSRRKLMKSFGEFGVAAERAYMAEVPNCPDLIQRATRMDFSNYLAEDILVKVDRSSMLNSLEVRAPFLDYRMIEFAYSKVPTRLKIYGGERKILLKRLTKRVLPAEFDSQRKQGFSIPLDEWIKRGEFRKLFYDVLSDPECCFDASMVASLLRGQDRGRKNGERLFALLLFELWRREYNVTF